ncbi:MAG: DNA starvation/stationary phase protection protein [Phenylobacterium sp.]|uniref:Dps family protein n=1 Tax=Phenylobacterium sp. TaxID=1871053 RepID=UPI0027336614|nr:DNA starvation/stationary phase protection protein [Phenylobacterium sp.]MDP3749919.1 DNA starvation/stationary phase protection protein [Phenylobacterium sp.]
MTNAGPNPAARKAAADGLARLLADSYAVYLKTHGYHWNVRGSNFAQLHTLFMDQYTEMWTAIDAVAERIRALGELAPQGYASFGKLSAIKDGDPASKAEGMVKDLISSHETLIGTLYSTLPAAQEAGDEVTAGLLTDRLTAHEKHAWMLRATLDS